jgi:hypothetical protein
VGTGRHCTTGAAAYSPYPSPIISAHTRSPTCHWETPSPVFTTVPEHSRPGMSGAPGGIGYRPMRCRQSARLTPAPAIRIKTSPVFGSGTGRVAGTSISGPPGALISMTVWVAGILASTADPLSTRMLK